MYKTKKPSPPLKSRHFYQVRLYKVQSYNKPETLSHILLLKRKGRFYIQSFANLIFAHHLEEEETLIFDIAYMKPRNKNTTSSMTGNHHNIDAGGDNNESKNATKEMNLESENQNLFQSPSENSSNIIADRKPQASPYEHHPIAIINCKHLKYSKTWRSQLNSLIYSKKKEEITILKLDLDYSTLSTSFKSSKLTNFTPTDYFNFYSRRNFYNSISNIKNKILHFLKQLLLENKVQSIPFSSIIEDLRDHKKILGQELEEVRNDKNLQMRQDEVKNRHEVVSVRARKRSKSRSKSGKNGDLINGSNCDNSFLRGVFCGDNIILFFSTVVCRLHLKMYILSKQNI